MRAYHVGAALGALALAGCAGQFPGHHTEALSPYPGLEQQITSYYDDHAVERDWECTEVQLDVITRAQVVRENADQVVMAIHYDFQEWDRPSGGGMCRGFNTRFFTFDKAGGSLEIARMSGEQRES